MSLPYLTGYQSECGCSSLAILILRSEVMADYLVQIIRDLRLTYPILWLLNGLFKNPIIFKN